MRGRVVDRGRRLVQDTGRRRLMVDHTIRGGHVDGVGLAQRQQCCCYDEQHHLGGEETKGWESEVSFMFELGK